EAESESESEAEAESESESESESEGPCADGEFSCDDAGDLLRCAAGIFEPFADCAGGCDAGDGECGLNACPEGDQACALDGALEVCDPTIGGWLDPQVCETGQVCDPTAGDGCIALACTPDTLACDGSEELTVCSEYGTRWVLEESCGAGEVCLDAACVPPPCSDGEDNDSDGEIDYPDEAGCATSSDITEDDPDVAPQCANGSDDDLDEAADFPADVGCFAASDDDEACDVFGTDAFGYVGCEEVTTVLPCPNISASGTYIPLEDDETDAVYIGFTFDFYGEAHDFAWISSNGKIGFPTNSSYGNGCLPASGETIFAWWDDLDPSDGGGTVRYATIGAAPNRTFEVQWVSEHYSGPSGRIDVRAVLHETSNQIDVCYVDTAFGASWIDYGSSATAGIQGGWDGGWDEFIEYSCNAPRLTNDLVLRYVHP
ncbi:MAG: hypothetical protein AABZ30_05930, partial [Myxococcota bacterium]